MKNTPLPSFLDVVAFLATADITPEQHKQIVGVINARVKTSRKAAMSTIRTGDRVKWSDKWGIPMSGVVTGTGRTRVYVTADGGGRWSVSASLLTKV